MDTTSWLKMFQKGVHDETCRKLFNEIDAFIDEIDGLLNIENLTCNQDKFKKISFLNLEHEFNSLESNLHAVKIISSAPPPSFF